MAAEDEAKLHAAREAASAAMMTPAALRPTLLRALSVLRWVNVYLYSAPLEALPTQTRLAFDKLASCRWPGAKRAPTAPKGCPKSR